MPFDDCRVAGDEDIIGNIMHDHAASRHETDISPKFHETRLGFCR